MDNDRVWYDKYVETEKQDQEEFRNAVLQDKKKGVSKKSPYTLGFMNQVWALTTRQFQLRLQDKFQLFTSFSMSTVSTSLDRRFRQGVLAKFALGPCYRAWCNVL